MTEQEFDDKPGIEHLRNLVRNFDHLNETFNTSLTIAELLLVYRAWMLSGWDIFPDQWEERQVLESFLGVVPKWDPATEMPVYQQPATELS